MTDERVYTVVGSAAQPATPISLADAGLKERSDLQEWVIAHPEILGPGIMVVTTEFDRWQAAGGARPLDRLDVLGLDSDGRLVVAELKRDRAPDTVEMQAIKYAAFVSRFDEDTLVEHHLAHLRGRLPSHQGLDAEAARAGLLEHAGGELDPEVLRAPRIVLVAGAFPPAVTATAVWLSGMGVPISLQSVQAYRVADGQIIVSVTQLFPIADVEDLTVGPRTAAATTRIRRRRERSAVVRIVDSGELEDGTKLTLKAPADVPADDRAAIEAWLAAHPARGSGTWRNDRARPIEWKFDGNGYRPTPLVREILGQAGLADRPISGSSWWVLPDGETLAQVGARVAGGFDWAPLHAILTHLPAGHWTTYGDLAEVVGTGPVALGQHLAACSQCANAWRVLGAEGRPRNGFTWSDPRRTDRQEDVLASEGVRFNDARADDAQRLRAANLAELEPVGVST